MMTSVLNTSLSKPFPVENLESIQSSVQSKQYDFHHKKIYIFLKNTFMDKLPCEYICIC